VGKDPVCRQLRRRFHEICEHVLQSTTSSTSEKPIRPCRVAGVEVTGQLACSIVDRENALAASEKENKHASMALSSDHRHTKANTALGDPLKKKHDWDKRRQSNLAVRQGLATSERVAEAKRSFVAVA
jgi:hypothetical protein